MRWFGLWFLVTCAHSEQVIFKSSQENLPQILDLQPRQGFIHQLTTVTIFGRHLTRNRRDILDVGLSLRASHTIPSPLNQPKNIDALDKSPNVTDVVDINANRPAEPILSCIWSARFLSTDVIQCKMVGVHGGLENIIRSARWDVDGGFVYVYSNSSGLLQNQSVYFSFLPACHLLTHKERCLSRGCYWCLYNTACLSSHSDCSEDCATPSVFMTCTERNGMIVTSVFIAMIVLLLVWFLRRQYLELRENITYRLWSNWLRVPLLRATTDFEEENVEEEEDNETEVFLSRSSPTRSLVNRPSQPVPISSTVPKAGVLATSSSSHPLSMPKRESRFSLAHHRYRLELERKHQILKQTDKLSSFF